MEIKREKLRNSFAQSFCVNADSGLSALKYHKFDFKLLNSKDKKMAYVNKLEDWVEFRKNSALQMRLFQNKLIDDENESPLKLILTPLSQSIQLNYLDNFDFDLHFKGSETYRGNVFKFYQDNIDGKNSNKTCTNTQSLPDLRGKGNIQSEIYQRKKLLQSIKITPLSDKFFYETTIKSLQTFSDYGSIINSLDFFLRSLVQNREESLAYFNQQSLFTTLTTIEKENDFEFLFICVVLVTRKILSSIIELLNSNYPIQNYVKNLGKDNTLIIIHYLTFFSNELKRRNQGTESEEIRKLADLVEKFIIKL